MPNMLEQVLRNVGELGLMKRPVRGSGMTNVPVDQGGESADLPIQESVDDPGLPPLETVKKKSPGMIAMEENDKKVADAVQNFKDTVLTQVEDPTRRKSYEIMIDDAARSIADEGPTNYMRVQTTIMKEIRSDAIRQENLQLKSDSAAAKADRQAERDANKAPPAYRIPREGLGPEFANMTDADISDLMKEQYKASHQQAGQGSDNVYPRLKGTSLKIMNDDTFKRSGLKTGDTVCIKIP